jgi:hypothetical protein
MPQKSAFKKGFARSFFENLRVGMHTIFRLIFVNGQGPHTKKIQIALFDEA